MKKTSAPRTTARQLLIPPGETLKQDFMDPLGLTAYAVAKAIGATPITISMITRGKRAISAEMAIRLGRYTGTTPEFWMNLQANFDLAMAKRESGEEISRRVVPLKLAA